DGGIVTRLDCVPFSIVVNKNAERFYDEGEDVWPNFEAGLIIEKVMDAVDRSAREQRWVNVE
ncbi:MAG: FAD-binding dehydrogenase, partial [Candidatus Puniceispirillaceae bacterium]